MVVEKGYKQTELGVIPLEWSVKTLKDACTYRRGSFPQPYGLSIWYDEINGAPFVQVFDIDSNWKIKPFTKRYISELAQKKSVFAPKGTIVLTIQGSIGRIAITQYDAFIDRTLLIFESFKIKFDKIYFCLAVESLFEKERQNAPGGIIKTITKEALSSFLIPIPPLLEQTAIATALSDMDALITQTEKLIEKKNAIKQGVMQELLRPKEGWVTKKLGDVCDIIKGQLITESTRVKGDIPVIAGGKTPAYYHNKANRLGKTITISGSGASAGYVSFHNYPIFASDCSTISESENYQVEYLFLWLKLNQHKIYKMQTGGAQPHIHPSDLNPMEINIPSIEQQKEIASVLFDLEKEIEIFENRLQKLKLQKQGMMQALLTGKIRLV